MTQLSGVMTRGVRTLAARDSIVQAHRACTPDGGGAGGRRDA